MRLLCVIAAMASGIVLAPGGGVHAQEPAFNIDCDSLGPAGTAFVRGINCRVVKVDGYPREYIVYVPRTPAFDLEKPTPVVFHYHGTNGGAENTLVESQWTDKAEQARFVAVFGSGLTYLLCSPPGCDSGEFATKWHDFSLQCRHFVDCRWRPPDYPEDAPWPANDVAFTDGMLADVQDGLRVDPRRIYLSGFSNGGGMVLRLAVDRSEIFAAAGTAGPGSEEVHEPSRHVPLYYAMGSLDGHMLDDINRQPDAPEPPLEEIPLTYDEAFAFSAVRSRFANQTATHGVSDVPDHVWEFHDELRISYRTPLSGIRDGSEVLLSFQGGVPHEFANADENREGFHDPDVFWKFFHDHPMPS